MKPRDEENWGQIIRKRDGFLMRKPCGHCRFMTKWEAFEYRFLGHIPAFITGYDHD